MDTVAAGAFRHGVDEFLIGPGPDADQRIRRNVRRKQLAERCFDGSSARIGMTAAGKRVTGGAIADDREITAALDLLEVLLVDIAGDGSAGRQRQHDAEKCRVRRVALTHGREDPDSSGIATGSLSPTRKRA